MDIFRALFIILYLAAISSCGGGSDGATSEPQVPNQQPIANIEGVTNGIDLTVLRFDGSKSTDSDGTIVSYQWAQLSNGAPQATIIEPSEVTTEIQIPDVLEKTTFQFQLTVSDNRGATNVAQIFIDIKDINCKDVVDDLSDSGVFKTDFSSEMVPGCNGDLYLANKELNQIEWLNVYTGEKVAVFPLDSTPTQLEFHPLSGKLYVAFASNIRAAEEYYAVIDRNEMTTEYVNLGTPVKHLTIKGEDDIFVVTDSNYDSGQLYHVKDGVFIGGPWPINGTAVRYNANLNQIIAVVYGFSPDTLNRYQIESDNNLILVESFRTNGANGNDLEISNDGSTVLLAAGGGNMIGYDIANFDSSNFSNVRGRWYVGAYPSSVSFSEDASMIVTANYSNLLVFDTQNYEEILNVEIPECPYGSLFDAEFSRGGKIAFVKQDCLIKVDGVNDRINYIHFFKLPPKL